MARGKVQMRRIDNPVSRKVTFCKRRAGLLKKAKELSVLCDADIGIITFSTHGKLYELATNGTMQSLIERYRYSSTSGQAQVEAGTCNQHQEMLTEIAMMKQEYNLQRIKLRFMYGESEILNMTLDELQAFEKYLEEWIYNIRSRKMHMMEQEIQLLKNKINEVNHPFPLDALHSPQFVQESMLKTTNEEKMMEQSESACVGPSTADDLLSMETSAFPFSTLTLDSFNF